MDPQQKRPGNEWVRGLALLAWVSWEVLSWGALGTVAGYFLGQALGVGAWPAALTGTLGLALAFWRIYRASQKLGGEP